MNALIIEDSKVMRQLIRNHLALVNVEVIGEAEDGLKGVELVLDLSPDLVTLDLHLPKLEGEDVIKWIKKYKPETKILVISALEAEEHESLYQLGADRIIPKPISKTQFEIEIQALMKK